MTLKLNTVNYRYLYHTLVKVKMSNNTDIQINTSKLITDFIEPICDLKSERLMYFPIKYQHLHELYKEQRSALWFFEDVEVSIINDHMTIDKLPEDIKSNIRGPLLFLAFGDAIIAKNLSSLANDIKLMEAQVIYAFQNHMEISTHNMCYSKMVLPFLGVDKLSDLAYELENTKELMDKKLFMEKYCDNIYDKLIVAILNEGLFFSSSFSYIGYCKLMECLMGIAVVNQYIQRDEMLHTKLSIALFHMLVNKPSAEHVYKLFDEAVGIECKFADYSIKIEKPEMTKEKTYNYIKYTADRLLEGMGYQPRYNTPMSLDFMNTFGLCRMNDFFTSHTTEYKSAVTYAGEVKYEFDEEF